MMNAGRVRQWCFMKKKPHLVAVIALSSVLVLTLLRGNFCDQPQEVPAGHGREYRLWYDLDSSR